MATLVLTVVGRVRRRAASGAAIGALIGQRIDGELFKPKGRDGPRLTDLTLQTSSYGSQIPRVFGTMRVAGCVIWSTDLIESRTTSRHKGQPSSTTYSYSRVVRGAAVGPARSRGWGGSGPTAICCAGGGRLQDGDRVPAASRAARTSRPIR